MPKIQIWARFTSVESLAGGGIVGRGWLAVVSVSDGSAYVAPFFLVVAA